eukprot:5733056-Prymnesium_polylepis.1
MRAMHARKPRVAGTHAMRRAGHTLGVTSRVTGHVAGRKRREPSRARVAVEHGTFAECVRRARRTPRKGASLEACKCTLSVGCLE